MWFTPHVIRLSEAAVDPETTQQVLSNTGFVTPRSVGHTEVRQGFSPGHIDKGRVTKPVGNTLTSLERFGMWMVEISYKPGAMDPVGLGVTREIADLGIKDVEWVKSRKIYMISGDFTGSDIEEVSRRLLCDSMVQEYRVAWVSSVENLLDVGVGDLQTGCWVVETRYRPGVNDPEAVSTQQGIEVLIPGKTVSVQTGMVYLIAGEIGEEEIVKICEKILVNPLIQIYRYKAYNPVSGVKTKYVETINLLDADLAELEEISRARMLALSLDEMGRRKEYYQKLGRNPTDIELEAIAQTWSEHCMDKTVKAIIKTPDSVVDSILKTYIMGATKKLGKPWCLSVFEDDAGLVEFDDELAIAFKVETHNHPTALDPYGGAGTGSGGVFRDILGVGAKPILSTDILFFGPPDYPHEKLPPGVMHPKRVMKSAVAGIRDYGNRMGIPTANGAIGFDERYVGTPLVFAGSLGIIPKDRYVREPNPGDIIVLVGGKTGKDGIHGVTFASKTLDKESEQTARGAVQIGSPIEEKKFADALIQARDRGDKPLYTAVKDCGGGGLSSAIGEMAHKIGAEVDLDKVPLKETGMTPWMIWVSESQERMVLAVPAENLGKVLEIFRGENSDATPIGRFRDDGKLVLRYKGEVVGELSTEFLHRGLPRAVKKARWEKKSFSKPVVEEKEDYTEDLLKILGSPNVASKEWVIRQYDHEVQARTVVKPLQGVFCDGPGDGCVLKPRYDSWRGVVVSNGGNPLYSDDPYRMALSAIDEAIRNNVALGGRRIALLDNFAWGNPDFEDRLGSLVEAARGCYDGAIAFGTPFISGKDSLNNEYILEDGSSIPVLPTLIVSAVGIIPDVRKAVTMDLKRGGDLVYILGVTRDEMGGSHYYKVNGYRGGEIPTVDLEEAPKSFEALTRAIDKGLVEACHDCSEGGLAVAAAEMGFAGGFGLDIELAKIPADGKLSDSTKLFSESNSRFLLEVRPENAEAFERVMAGHRVARIGQTTLEKRLVIRSNNNAVVEAELEKLRETWKKTFKW